MATSVPQMALYEWVVRNPSSHNPITYGVVAYSAEEARSLIRKEYAVQAEMYKVIEQANQEESMLTSDEIFEGIVAADVHFVGPYTSFAYNREHAAQNASAITDGYTPRGVDTISRRVMEESLSYEPCRVLPIGVGTTFLFSALDG